MALRSNDSDEKSTLPTGFALGAHTARADIDGPHFTVDHQFAPMNIRAEIAIRSPLGVADVMAEAFRLSTDVTLTGHGHPRSGTEIAAEPGQDRTNDHARWPER